MALKAIYDKQEDIPEAHRELFTERNGKWELTEVEGVKTSADVDRVTTSLTKERDEHKKTKEKLSKFGDSDPEKTHGLVTENEELKAKLEAAEAAAGDNKPDEDTINKLVDAKVATVARPLEREIEKLKADNLTQSDTITGHELKDTNRTITDSVRSAATGSKIHSTAMEDALMLAERVFEVAEDGTVLTKDNVGVTPGIDPVVWFTEMQDKRAHWWPTATGGGAGGGSGPGAGGAADNPFGPKAWNLTEQGAMVRTDPERADRMAKSAGTTVGGPRPAEAAKAPAA